MSKTKKDTELLSDSEIVSEILNNSDPSLFSHLYDRYALKVYRKCLSFTKDEAEAKDVAHDIMVKLYLKLSQFTGHAKFSTWVYAITYNHCVDHQAKKKKQISFREGLKKDLEEEVKRSTDEPSDEDIMQINYEVLVDLLEKIKVTEKSILLMKYQDGMSIKDIALVIGAGESAVKMKLKRSKAKLMMLYEQGRK